MAYDKKFKIRVLEYLSEGHTQRETAETFRIGTTTIKEWKKQKEAGGTFAVQARKRKPKKIEPDRLKGYVSAHPDAYLSEIATEFGCVNSAVHKALKRLGITRKKRR